MTTVPRRHTCSGCSIGLLLLLASRAFAAAAEPTASAMPRVEIDRSVIVIDIAAQRRALDASISRELTRNAAALRNSAARGNSRAHDLAAAGQRPRG
jgi:hypothetical protein